MVESESSKRKGKKEIVSKKALGVALSKIKGFDTPKVRLEQYPTDPEIAAEVLWQVGMRGEIGEVSVDLGCGTGVLGIGLLLIGAKKVIMVDLDPKVIVQAKNNLLQMQSEYLIEGEAIFLNDDIKEFYQESDIVVENPPFGVKNCHADKAFLEKAFETAKVIYSFHKSESKNFVDKLASDNGFKITEEMKFNFPLKASYDFHTKKIKRIDVSCFRMEKREKKGF